MPVPNQVPLGYQAVSVILSLRGTTVLLDDLVTRSADTAAAAENKNTTKEQKIVIGQCRVLNIALDSFQSV